MMKQFVFIIFLLASFKAQAQPDPGQIKEKYASTLLAYIDKGMALFVKKLNSEPDYKKKVFSPCIETPGKGSFEATWMNFYNELMPFLSIRLSDAKEFFPFKKSQESIYKDLQIAVSESRKVIVTVENICKELYVEKPVEQPVAPVDSPTINPQDPKDKPGKEEQKPDPPKENGKQPPIDTLKKKQQEGKKDIDTPKTSIDTIIKDQTDTGDTKSAPNPPNKPDIPLLAILLTVVLVMVSLTVFAVYRSQILKWKATQLTGFSLPGDLPEIGHISSLNDLEKKFESGSKQLTPELRKSLFWSLRLMQVTDGGTIFKNKVPGYMFTAFGFFSNRLNDYSYGVIIYYSPGVLKKIKIGIRQLFTYYKRQVQVDNNYFPVVYRPISIVLHDFNCNPLNGTGTCYVSKKNTNVPTGILTAKHVAPDLETEVTLSCGSTGSVTEIGPGIIDSVVIESACVKEHAKNARATDPQQFIAPYIDAEFWGARSSIVHTKVTHITDTRGIFNSSLLAVIIFLTEGGVNGDSGALVSSEKPFGIYLGKYYSEGIGSGGLAQQLYQVTEMMNLKIYT